MYLYISFCLLFCWFEKKKDAKRTENNAQRRQTKCLFGFEDHRFHMFTDDICSGKRRLVLLKPTHMVIDQLIHVIQGLEKIGWLLDTDLRKINVNFLTTICRQTVFVKKSLILFVYFVCK